MTLQDDRCALAPPDPPGDVIAACAPASAVPHASWCVPHRHQWDGELDQTCRGDVLFVAGQDGSAADPDGVAVSVEQYVTRRRDERDWRRSAATVLLQLQRLSGADLTPDEARRVAYHLLVAADRADGITEG